MLGPGDPVPDVRVWAAPREEARRLRELLGTGYALLCFYVWDWSLWYISQYDDVSGTQEFAPEARDA
jgi:hypothetical protein